MGTYVEPIDQAIAGYADRIGDAGPGTPPYDGASLAIIYGPRVQELVDLQNQGFTHAEWRWDDEAKTNRWHGVA